MANLSFDQTMGKPQSTHSDGTDAIGFLHFWGLSPALDLIGENLLENNLPRGHDPHFFKPVDKNAACTLTELVDDEYNILISGGADLRHVMKTVAKYHNVEPRKKLNFFLHDQQAEVSARHILMAKILNKKELTPRDRAELFLSVFGNCLIRDRDSKFISEQVKELIEVVSESKEHALNELFDFSHLKYKERDALESAIKQWKETIPFEMEELREQRLRGYYRTRYDFRKNLMDSDYQWNIKEVTPIIHWQQYKEFGHTGIAFESRLGKYDQPNRTLASYLDGTDRQKGHKIEVRGFWGDIINSPYFCFGVNTNKADRHRLFKVANDQQRHTACDVAEFNVQAFISEMETFEELNLPPEKPEEHQFPYRNPLEDMRKATITEVEDDLEKVEKEGKGGAGKNKKEELLPAFENVSIKIMSGELLDVLKKSKYKNKFDQLVFGNMATMPLLHEAKFCNDLRSTREAAAFGSEMKPTILYSP